MMIKIMCSAWGKPKRNKTYPFHFGTFLVSSLLPYAVFPKQKTQKDLFLRKLNRKSSGFSIPLSPLF